MISTRMFWICLLTCCSIDYSQFCLNYSLRLDDWLKIVLNGSTAWFTTLHEFKSGGNCLNKVFVSEHGHCHLWLGKWSPTRHTFALDPDILAQLASAHLDQLRTSEMLKIAAPKPVFDERTTCSMFKWFQRVKNPTVMTVTLLIGNSNRIWWCCFGIWTKATLSWLEAFGQ